MGKLRSVMAGVFLGGVLLGGVGTGIAMVEYSTLSYGGEHLMGEDYLVTKNLDFDFPQDGRILILGNDYYSYDGYRDVAIEADDSVPVGMVRYEVTYNEKTVRPELIFQEYEEDDQMPEQVNVEKYEEPEESEVAEEREDLAAEASGGEEGQVADGAPQEPGEEAVPRDENVDDVAAGDVVPGDENASDAAAGDVVPEDENTGDTEPEMEPGKEENPVYLGMLSFRVYNHEDGFMTLMENKDRFLEELKEKKISSYRQTYVIDVKVKVNPQTMPFVRNREDGYRY